MDLWLRIGSALGPICGICHLIHSHLCQVQFRSTTFEHRWCLRLFLLAQTQFRSCHLPKRRMNNLLLVILGGVYLSLSNSSTLTDRIFSPKDEQNILRGILHGQTRRSITPLHTWYNCSMIFVKLQHFPLVLLPSVELFPGYASFNWYLLNVPVISCVSVLISNAFHELQLLIGWVP